MKKKIKILAIMIALVLSMCGSISVQAATKKDVTKAKKTSIAKFMKPYTNFLAYPISYGSVYNKVKFDDIYKTNMILYSHAGFYEYYNQPVAKVKKSFEARVKKVFGKSAKFKIKKGNDQNYPTLFVNDHGKVFYRGGDWGGGMPYGKVSKVYKVGSKKYRATYKVYVGGYGMKKTASDYVGSYEISLKQNGKTYVIANIKRA